MGATAPKHGRIDSKWLRPLEYCLFATAAVFGLLILVPILVEIGVVDGLAVAYSMGMLALVPLGFVFAIVVAVVLYMDAKRVRTANLEWTPSPGLYGVLGFVFSGLAAIDYLYKRNEYAGGRATSSVWWYGVVGLAALGVGTAGLEFATSLWVVQVPKLLVVALPICLYKDSSYVGETTDWNPNPATYFTGGLFALLAFVLFSVVGTALVLVLLAAYGVKRRRAFGSS